MTTQTRPTCGTCPHSVEVYNQLGVQVAKCFLLPVPLRQQDRDVLAGEHTPGCHAHPDMPAFIASWNQQRAAAQHDDPMAYTCGHQEAFGGYALAYCPGHEPDTGCGIEWMACEQCRDNPELLARAQTWLLTHKCQRGNQQRAAAPSVTDLRRSVLNAVPIMVSCLQEIERREGLNMSRNACIALDECCDELTDLLEIASKETP